MASEICMHAGPSGLKEMANLSTEGDKTMDGGTTSGVLFETTACLCQCPTTVLSQDSQVHFVEHSKVVDNGEVNRFSRGGPDHIAEDAQFTNGFSEEHLLNITFEACDTMGKGEVLASAIMGYLREMTAQSPDQEKLTALHDLLDPECKDPPVSRDTFHNIMRTWIAQCQDSKPEDYAVSGIDCGKLQTDGIERSASEPGSDFPETGDASPCDCRDLLSVLEELKHTRQRLSEQNSGLLRTVSQCEDTNLQLIVEITDLRSKLTSAQRSAARAQSMSEELDEMKRALWESQEKATGTQANISKLKRENEYLRAHIKTVEEANEKLGREKISFEGLVSKLMEMHTSIREELNEALVALAGKEKEATKKSLFIADLKISCLENYKIIEGVQMELLQLQEKFHEELLRFSSSSALPPSTLERGGPGAPQRSLQAEIEEAQKQQANTEEAKSPLCGIVFPHNPRNSEEILQQVLTQELAEFGGVTSPDMKITANSEAKALEATHLKCQQQQASIRKHLANVEQELELQRTRQSKVEGQLSAALEQAQEAKKMAAISWCRALKVEEEKAEAIEDINQASLDTRHRPQKAEGAVQELREQLCHLKGTLRATQQQVDMYRILTGSEVCEFTENGDKSNKEDFREQAGNREQKDVAAAKDPEGETQASTTKLGEAPDPVSEILLVFTRRVEDLARWAHEAVELSCVNKRRFSLAKVRLETPFQKMEQALLSATEADVQLQRSPACMSATLQSIGHSCSSGPGLSGLASLEPTIAEEHGGQTSKTSGSQCVSDRASFGTGGRDTNSQGCLEADGGGIPSLTDKPSSNLFFEEASRRSNGCCRNPPLETSPPDQEQSPTGLRVPSAESNSVGISPHSHGPRTVTLSQHGAEHVGGEEGSDQSDASQPKPPENGRSHTVGLHLLTLTDLEKAKEEHCSQHIPPAAGDGRPKETTATTGPHLRSRGPAMPTLPEEEEDSPEEFDSSSSSPVSCTPAGSRTANMVLPTPSIIVPDQSNMDGQDPKPLKQARSQSPRPRLSRSSSGNPITTIDSAGHVIDLVKDTLPEMQLSEEDKKKNLELLEEAKKVSDRFLTRRGRRSTCSLSESPTGVSPNPTPRSSPVPSRSSSLTVPPQGETTEVIYANPSAGQHLEVPGIQEQGDPSTKDPENSRNFVDWKATEKRKVSSGTLCPRYGPKESQDPQHGGERGKKAPVATVEKAGEVSVGRGSPRVDSRATAVAKPVPRPPAQQVPCTAEIKTIGAFPPLMRAVSWDAASCAAPSFSRKGKEGSFPFEPSAPDSSLKSSGYKDFPLQPVKMQKLAKIREEHMTIQNQSTGPSKLPELSETAEQDRASTMEEECKEKLDVMPNISDMMLRKLKLHRALPGGAPSLTEKEVENAFVQLSLAFRNDNYTLEMRLRHAERERNMTEENTEKELEEFKGCLKNSVMLWQNSEQREAYQRLLETVAVLHRLAIRLSSRAEMVGAVRQEKRMNKATEVMMQYVENLKRTYEKDHAELMEFKKLANQNSSRCYGGSMDNGDDGVPRSSRSMSLTLGKALPRRRVSVAVVPKFNLLNIPGQSPNNSGPGLPVVCEGNSVKCTPPNEPTQQAATESGKASADQEGETSAPNKPSAPINPDEIISELKAKIEEDAFNKGYQEGLKRSKELQELKEEEEKAEKSQEGDKEQDLGQEKKCSSKYEEALDILERMCPKMFRRNRLFWIVFTLLGVAFFLVSVLTYFSDHYSERGDPPTGKSVNPGKKKFFGWNVKNPAPE